MKCFVLVLVSFLFFIILDTLTLMSFAFYAAHDFGGKMSQLPLHLSKLIMNG